MGRGRIYLHVFLSNYSLSSCLRCHNCPRELAASENLACTALEDTEMLGPSPLIMQVYAVNIWRSSCFQFLSTEGANGLISHLIGHHFHQHPSVVCGYLSIIRRSANAQVLNAGVSSGVSLDQRAYRYFFIRECVGHHSLFCISHIYQSSVYDA